MAGFFDFCRGKKLVLDFGGRVIREVVGTDDVDEGFAHAYGNPDVW